MFAKLLSLLRPKVFSIASSLLLIAAILSQFDDLPLFQKYRTFFIFAGVILTVVSAFLGITKEMRPLVDDLLSGQPAPKWLRWMRAGGIYIRREEVIIMFFLLLLLITLSVTLHYSVFAALGPVLAVRRGKLPTDLTPQPSRIPYLPGISRKYYKNQSAIAMMSSWLGNNLLGTPIDPIVSVPRLSTTSPDYFSFSLSAGGQDGIVLTMKPARNEDPVGAGQSCFLDNHGEYPNADGAIIAFSQPAGVLGGPRRVYPVLLTYSEPARVYAITLLGQHAFAPIPRELTPDAPRILQLHPVGAVADSRFGDHAAFSINSMDTVWGQPCKTIVIDKSKYDALTSQEFLIKIDVVIYDCDVPMTLSLPIDRGSMVSLLHDSSDKMFDVMQVPVLRTLLHNSLYPTRVNTRDYSSGASRAVLFGMKSVTDPTPIEGSINGLPISNFVRMNGGMIDISGAIFSTPASYTPRAKQLMIQPLQPPTDGYEATPSVLCRGIKESGFGSLLPAGLLLTRNAQRQLAQVSYEFYLQTIPIRTPGNIDPLIAYDTNGAQAFCRVSVIGQGPNVGRALTFIVTIPTDKTEIVTVDDQGSPDETAEVGMPRWSVLHDIFAGLAAQSLDSRIAALKNEPLIDFIEGDVTLIRAVTMQFDDVKMDALVCSPVGTTSRFTLKSSQALRLSPPNTSGQQNPVSVFSHKVDLVSPTYPSGDRLFSLGQPIIPIREFVSPDKFVAYAPTLTNGIVQEMGKFKGPFMFMPESDPSVHVSSFDMFGYGVRVNLNNVTFMAFLSTMYRNPVSLSIEQIIYDIAPEDSPSLPITQDWSQETPFLYGVTNINLTGYNNDLGCINPVNVPTADDYWSIGL